MAVLDLSDPIDVIRLNVGDHLDLEILEDTVYEYLLAKHNNNTNAASKEAAYLILAVLSQTSSRQRLDRIEIHNDSFENYLTFLKEYVKSASSTLNLAGIYAAGISKTDVLANQSDPDIVQRRMPWGPNGEYSPITNPFDCDSSSF
jgi:hypothetical protein